MAMGRPRKEIDIKQFENLCKLQCTETEICEWFEVCEDTLNKWCKETYGQTFSEIYAQKRGQGRISLRRTQWKHAENSASMAMFLGKQYLGQSDNTNINLSTNEIKINWSDDDNG